MAGTPLATLLCTVLLGTAVWASPVAREVDGVVFPGVVELPDGELPLRGAGILRYGFFFTAYVAALYTDQAPGSEVLGVDSPRRLEIVYRVAIPRDRMTEFAEQRLRGQLEGEAWDAIAPRLAEWHSRFRSVQSGDRYVMQFADGLLVLVLNGERLAAVRDPELARLYFGLWLGEQPLDADLRRALLGVAGAGEA